MRPGSDAITANTTWISFTVSPSLVHPCSSFQGPSVTYFFTASRVFRSAQVVMDTYPYCSDARESWHRIRSLIDVRH
jgi:hypothetical protein